MQEIKSLVFEKIEPPKVLGGMAMFASILAGMYMSISFTELQSVGILISGIIIGLSFVYSKNVIFPVIMIVGYNSLVVAFRSSIPEISSVFQITDVLIWIGEGLFISFVTVWVGVTLKIIIEKYKEMKTNQQVNEPITIRKLIIGATIAGILFAILMEITAL